MIVSVHLADLSPGDALRALARPPRPERNPGLRYAVSTVVTTMGGRLLPSPRLGRIALVASWDDEASLSRFLEEDSFAGRIEGGWEARLQPIRAVGKWPAMPGLPEQPLPVDDSEPVVVLTLGRPRLRKLLPFLRSAAAAEAEAVAEPGLLASAGLGRPPGLVSTFSLWRSAAEMRDYAVRGEGMHSAALRRDREIRFHHDSAFVRFRPLSSRGLWDGRDPLATE